MSSEKPETSVIIPVLNQVSFTRLCLNYLRKNTPQADYEIIVVDNGSNDTTPLFLKEIQSQIGNLIVIRNDENLGFAKACNQGASSANGKYLVFLNNDTVPHTNWLSTLVEVVKKDPSVGIVGSKLIFPDGTIQHAGVVFDMKKLPNHIYFGMDIRAECVSIQRDFEAVTGACMLISKEDFFRAGKFDEAYQNGYEDIDLCKKIRKMGKRIVYNPESVLTHFQAQTEGRFKSQTVNERLFHEKWGASIFQDDYCYLKKDRMDIYINERGFLFYETAEKIEMHVANVLDLADRHVAMADTERASLAYTSILNSFPYQIRVLKAVLGHCIRIGATDQAQVLKKLIDKYSSV